MSTPPEHQLVAEHLDRRPWGPSEPDEQQVLAELYGEADPDGIYRGEARA